MSTIRCIYTADPGFPATDQHPSAVRYKVGSYIVDAIGGQPTQTDVDAVLNPPQQAVRDPIAEIDAIKAKFVEKGEWTKADADAVSASSVAAVLSEVKPG